jgi:hypothetical protein
VTLCVGGALPPTIAPKVSVVGLTLPDGQFVHVDVMPPLMPSVVDAPESTYVPSLAVMGEVRIPAWNPSGIGAGMLFGGNATSATKVAPNMRLQPLSVNVSSPLSAGSFVTIDPVAPGLAHGSESSAVPHAPA